MVAVAPCLWGVVVSSLRPPLGAVSVWWDWARHLCLQGVVEAAACLGWESVRVRLRPLCLWALRLPWRRHRQQQCLSLMAPRRTVVGQMAAPVCVCCQ